MIVSWMHVAANSFSKYLEAMHASFSEYYNKITKMFWQLLIVAKCMPCYYKLMTRKSFQWQKVILKATYIKQKENICNIQT